jgi:hypothetical protein
MDEYARGLYSDQYVTQDIQDSDVSGGHMSNYFNLRRKLESPKYNNNNTKMQPGYPEDVLRGDQYGIPLNLNARSTNPYIMEDIAKTQRLAPIRGGTVETRSEQIGEQRQIDGHYAGPCGCGCRKKAGDVVINIDKRVFMILLIILGAIIAVMAKSMFDGRQYRAAAMSTT